LIVRQQSRSGINLEDIDGDGRFEISTSDPRFDCLYSPCVSKYTVLMIRRLKGRNFVNATRRYPTVVKQAADRAMKAYVESRHGGSGWRDAIAAYTALTCLLGRERCQAALRLVAAEARAGMLNGTNYEDTASEFVAKLRADLIIFGYTTP
jgi:hypothetical protein